MALIESLDVFFDAFAVPVTAGAVSGLGILDAPTLQVGGEYALSDEYLLTCKTSDFGSLVFGSAITVGGTAYKVRENRRIDDGALCEISLTKV